MYKTIYIIGPMTGIPYYNFPAFDAVAEELRAQGHVVYNPADLDRLHGFDPFTLPRDHDWNTNPDTLPLSGIIQRDLEAAQKCNTYWTLPDWENSIGARAEKAVLDWSGAQWLNDPDNQAPLASVQNANPKIKPLFHNPPPQAAGLFNANPEIIVAIQPQADPSAKNFNDPTQPQIQPQPPADPRLLGPGGAPTRATILPEDAAGRKTFPIASGCLDYFPDAIAAVANLSWKGNQQHNPGQPLYWNRAKSRDEDDTLMRHFLQRGTLDADGIRHSTKLAWRALAILQKEIETQEAFFPAEPRP